MRDAVVVEANIAAPVETVWRFLTLERGTWWPDLRFDAVVGAPLVETWTEGGVPMRATGVVTRCEAPVLLAFSWTEPRWQSPLAVVIRLVADAGSTAVAITETGFVGAGPEASLPDEHEEGWRYHLSRLKHTSEADPAVAVP